MGMFKRMKDMKDMVEAAPGLIQQAQQLGAQAQEMAAAQQAAMQAQAVQNGGFPAGAGVAGAGVAGAGVAGTAVPGAVMAGADFEPVAGVTLEQFAAVSKGVAAYGYDPTKLPEIAASKGISAFAWDTASRGWNERIHRNRAVAQRFNQLYRAS